MRRALIHSQPVSRVPAMSKLAGKVHLHSCVDRMCRLVYEDLCQTPGVNGRCHVCRRTSRPVWVAARDPVECCFGNCVQLTDTKTLRLYRLGGPGPWFMCKTCARCHGWPCA